MLIYQLLDRRNLYYLSRDRLFVEFVLAAKASGEHSLLW